MNWIYEASLKKAEQLKIKGVTYDLTIGMIK